MDKVKLLLRAEGAAPAGVLGYFVWTSGVGWMWVVGVLIAPDLSLAGYYFGAKRGAFIYNCAHTYVGPALAAGAGFALGNSLLVSIATIWALHIGIDRFAGFGLKYPTSFSDTHLGRLGGK